MYQIPEPRIWYNQEKVAQRKINYFMNRIKLSAVILVVLGLAVLNVVRFNSAKADDTSGQSVIGGQGTASGQESGNSTENGGIASMGENSQNGPSLSVDSTDKVVMTGASLVSNSGQSLTVKIFGLDLNLAITSSTSLVGMVQMSASSTSSISDMKAGDVIDAAGQIDAGSGIITVDQLRDETMQQQNVQSIQQQIQALLAQLKLLQEQLNMQPQQSGG